MAKPKISNKVSNNEPWSYEQFKTDLEAMYNLHMKQKENGTTELTPFSELDRFCKEYDFFLELEKPFKEFEELILRVVNKEGKVLGKETVPEILEIDRQAAYILNDLAKVY